VSTIVPLLKKAATDHVGKKYNLTFVVQELPQAPSSSSMMDPIRGPASP
jgi:hypothetical protein